MSFAPRRLLLNCRLKPSQLRVKVKNEKEALESYRVGSGAAGAVTANAVQRVTEDDATA